MSFLCQRAGGNTLGNPLSNRVFWWKIDVYIAGSASEFEKNGSARCGSDLQESIESGNGNSPCEEGRQLAKGRSRAPGSSSGPASCRPPQLELLQVNLKQRMET